MNLQVAEETETSSRPRLWGLTPIEMHDRFWAARGVQPIRLGEEVKIARQAELFLLLPPETLVRFRLAKLLDRMSWLKLDLLFVRLESRRGGEYREVTVEDRELAVRRLQRLYEGPLPRHVEVALTPDPELAALWARQRSAPAGWRLLRELVHRWRSDDAQASGQIYDGRSLVEAKRFIEELPPLWRRPDGAVRGLKKIVAGVWAHPGVSVDRSAKLAGPIWIGAGRSIPNKSCVVGPVILWDDPLAGGNPAGSFDWKDIAPLRSSIVWQEKSGDEKPRGYWGKRAFDILFALFALAITLPFYPLFFLAILLQDGWPIFFTHRRQGFRGREFPCLKFRTMKKNAELEKRALQAQNGSDGPQFFMPDDPRLLPLGHLFRKLKLDELPQFINVLLGQMSVVGPRPSPEEENQYCPEWRDARLSVRPGITGLWQVKRTRQRGLDFQEWIRYDIEYVEKVSFWLDLWILWRTITVVLRGR
jgi:lipopolysaccharide/colanic/teichoic acid biosynthesis glycosyltransferase